MRSWLSKLVGMALAIPTLGFCQPDTVWTRSIHTGNDPHMRMISDRNGGYVIGASYRDFLLYKMNPDGGFEWSNSFAGRPNGYDVGDQLWGLSMRPGGGIVLTGSSGGDNMIVKTDSDGDEIWRGYYYLHEDVGTLFYNCFTTPDDQIFITGNEVLKLDAEGGIIWRWTYPIDRYPGYFAGIIPLSDGNYLLYGAPNPMGGPDFYTVKIDSDGEEISHHLYGRENITETCVSAVETIDRGWCLFGGYQGYPGLIVKTDSAGEMRWMSYHEDVTLKCGIETADGGLSAVGDDPNDYLIQIRVDCNGDTLWTKRWGAWREGRVSGWLVGDLRSILLEEDGGYVMAGHTDGGGPYDQGVFIQRTEPDTVDLPQEIAASDSLLNFGEVAVDSTVELTLHLSNTGRRWTQVDSSSVASRDLSAFSHDFEAPVRFYPWDTLEVAVAFHPLADTMYESTLSVWVEGEAREVVLLGSGVPLSAPDDGEGTYPVPSDLVSAHPNPFNSITSIDFSIPDNGLVRLVIHDLKGQEIAVLNEGNLGAGRYTSVWDASRHSSGVYLCRLQTGDNNKTIKIILVR